MRRSRRSQLDDLTHAELLLKIAQARSFMNGGTPLPNAARLIRRIMGGYATNRMPVHMNGIWRGRKNEGNTAFRYGRELWYPPVDKAVAGRLNRHGEVLFYGTDQIMAVAKELRLRVGDVFTVMQAEAKQRLANVTLAHLGMHHSKSPLLERTIQEFLPRNAPGHLQMRLHEGINRKWLKVDDFLAEVLTSEASNAHLLSQEIASVMKSMAGIDGLLYPSVATRLNCTNVCLFTHVADNLFEPKRFYQFEVLSVGPNGDLMTTPPKEGEFDIKTDAILWK